MKKFIKVSEYSVVSVDKIIDITYHPERKQTLIYFMPNNGTVPTDLTPDEVYNLIHERPLHSKL